MNQHLDIPPDEFIIHRSFEKLVNRLATRPILKKNYSLRHCCTENIANEFEAVSETNTLFKMDSVVVSSYSDYGVHEQALSHPNNDLPKRLARLPWAKMFHERERYTGFEVGPCCNLEKCVPSHKYSVKVDGYTTFTFNDLPHTIKTWFVTNLNVSHPRMKWIPFGMNDDDLGDKWNGLQLIPEIRKQPKKSLLYVNFQDNTIQRLQLKEFFKNCPWVTFRQTVGLPHEQFLSEMADHKFVLSPPGNGLDCYRNYEAMYLGCVPILLDSVFSDHLLEKQLPVMTIRDMTILRPEILLRYYELLQNSSDTRDLSSLRMSHWERKLIAEVDD